MLKIGGNVLRMGLLGFLRVSGIFGIFTMPFEDLAKSRFSADRGTAPLRRDHFGMTWNTPFKPCGCCIISSQLLDVTLE